MLADDHTVLADHDAIGESLDLDRAADGAQATEYLLVSNRTKQVFETAACVAWNPSNAPRIGTSWGRSVSNFCYASALYTSNIWF